MGPGRRRNAGGTLTNPPVDFCSARAGHTFQAHERCRTTITLACVQARVRPLITLACGWNERRNTMPVLERHDLNDPMVRWHPAPRLTASGNDYMFGSHGLPLLGLFSGVVNIRSQLMKHTRPCSGLTRHEMRYMSLRLEGVTAVLSKDSNVP